MMAVAFDKAPAFAAIIGCRCLRKSVHAASSLRLLLALRSRRKTQPAKVGALTVLADFSSQTE